MRRRARAPAAAWTVRVRAVGDGDRSSLARRPSALHANQVRSTRQLLDGAAIIVRRSLRAARSKHLLHSAETFLDLDHTILP
jgi:hypothetical protein